jgi:predicted amidophosphoribosyltransferase
VAIRFRQIDATNLGDHTYLREDDQCLFLHEYTSGKTFAYSDANQLISNLKKKQGDGGYHYKARAIGRCATELAAAISHDWLRRSTLVPTPPSKAKTDPAYDDRMLRVCNALAAQVGGQIDIREIIVQPESMPAFHTGTRATVDQLVAAYRIDETKLVPPPRAIAVIDDVLTAGTHYRAMYNMLSAIFPDVPIIGIFIARRVFPNDTFDEIFGTPDA